eukprot:g8505.t1
MHRVVLRQIRICVVAGVAAAFQLPPTTAFVAPTPPATPDDRTSRAARRFPPPRRSLISSWLVGEDKRPENPIQIQTQTVQAQLDSFENTRQTADNLEEDEEEHDVTATRAADSAGLLCLERAVPAEVLRGLEHLANITAPFKVEVVRAGGEMGVDNDGKEGWLDTLTANISKLGISSSSSLTCEESDLGWKQEYLSSDQVEEEQFLEKSWKGRNRRKPKRKDSMASPPQRQLAAESHAAVRWLKADIKRLGSLFAREASVLSAAAISSFGDGYRRAVGDCRDTLTVKLELLNKGKCPRFHLDKVPIRLICTYVGPSTEWLDGYDKREMETNRSPPPACNLKIRDGREARHARPGDVLVFRGQPEGGPVQGGAFGVAHRSPDTVEGQRRLVLTMDAGDLNGLAAAAHPAS